MALTFAILAYAAAMTLANLSIAYFGPASIPINAFVLIGLDLALRDLLHVRLTRWQMALLIVSAGMLTYGFNADAGRIAVASSCAFMLAAIADWLTFSRLKGSWMYRSNVSNTVGAAVDSLVFPALAGWFDPITVGTMFLAKVAGASLWSWALSRRVA